MMISVMSILFVLIALCLSFLYLAARYQKNNKKTAFDAIKKHWKCAGISFAAGIFIIAGNLIFTAKSASQGLELLLKWDALLLGLLTVSVTDWKEKKIPNAVIGAMLIVRLAFLIYEALSAFEFIKQVLIYPLLGAAIGAGIMLASLLISRKSVGMGDVKLYFVIGAYVGSTAIIPVMIYSFFMAASVGLGLLLTKKAKMKDSIPMAPFAFAGAAIEFALSMISAI